MDHADSKLEREVIDKGDKALAAAEKGAAASGAGVAVSAGLRAGRVVLPWISKPITWILTAVAGMAFIAFFSIFTIIGGGSERGRVPYAVPENPADSIPEQMLSAYVQFDSPNVPWTIFAAIGELATNHGRWSPYDSVDRAPERGSEFDGRVLTDAGAKGGGNNEVAYYPEVRPAIGSADNGEAQGPLLLWPELLIEHPDKNPQNIHDSLEIAAAEVVNIVESLAAQGITPPDNPQDPAEIDAFWEQVFDQFRGGRVVPALRTSDEGCGLTHDVGVDVLIATAFRCASTGAEQIVVGASENNGTVSYKTVGGVEAVAALVDDAIGLGYAWGTSDTAGGKHPWDGVTIGEWAGVGCVATEGVEGFTPEEGREVVGVLPVSVQEAAALGISNRCDPIEVATKVAEAVMAYARTEVATRSEKEVAFNGWHQLRYALGDDSYRKAYIESLVAPVLPGSIDFEACLAEWERFFFGANTDLGTDSAVAMTAILADGPAASGVSVHNGSLPSEVAVAWFESGRDGAGVFSDPQSLLRTQLEEMQGARVSGECVEVLGLEAAWASLRELYGGAHNDSGEMGEEGEQAEAMVAGMDVWVEYVSLVDEELARTSTLEWGREPAVRRYIVDEAVLAKVSWAPQAPPSLRQPIPTIGFGRRVVVTAIRLGGLFVRDPRGGTQLALLDVSLALLPTNKCLQPNNVSCDPAVEAAGHIDNEEKRTLMRREGTLIPIGGSESPCPWMGESLGQKDFVARLQRMCADAAAEGVKIPGAGGSRTYAQQVATKKRWCDLGKCYMAATPGNSFHEWGLAFDLTQSNTVYDWVHQIVGCYAGDVYAPDPSASYRPLSQPLTRQAYVASNPRPCSDNEYPVKRANLYGVVFPVCQASGAYPQRLKSDTWIMCSHEPWHVQPGVLLSVTFDTVDQMILSAGDVEGCYTEGLKMPLSGPGGERFNRQRVGQMTWSVFHCVLINSGFGTISPTNVTWTYQGRTYTWDGRKHGFTNKAEQVASEALVVAYCESLGYDPANLTSNNFTGKYGGLFQMGDAEMGASGLPNAAGLKFDPVANAYAAAHLFIRRQSSQGGRWDGWQPWAVVNTSIGAAAKVHNRTPSLPRFPSTSPNVVGMPGGELPLWAVNPFAYEIPPWQGTGCPPKHLGGSWPPATPLPGQPNVGQPQNPTQPGSTPPTPTVPGSAPVADPVEADPVEVEVLREQSHEVVMGYLTRMADLHSPNFQGVSPSDRFEGPLVAAMIAQAAYNDYMLACVSAGLCERGQGLIGGQVEALAPAGSEVILPYGDGTYYVSGVYANSRTRVFAAGYLGGFRFRVDDGQAVLIDAVVWPWQTVDGSGGEDVRGMWMSERSFPGTAAASRVKVTSHNPNMTFGPALTFVPVTATRAKDFVLVFEATNNGSSEIVPLPTEGVDSILRRVPPGETRTEIYRGFYDASQMGGTFSFEISDAVGGNGRLATVEVSLPNARNCASTDEVEPAVIREGDCIRPSAIARARGFINHTN